MTGLEIGIPQEFRPLKTSRRGELYAWLFTLIVLLVLFFMPGLQERFLTVGTFLAIFFGLSAVVISLNNWMERATVLQLSEDGIAYRNGLRNVQFIWSEIERVEVVQRNIGRRVHVLGPQAHFAFYMQSAVKLGNRVGELTGFEQGEDILETILQKASLTPTAESSDDVYYYARD
ncbi:MAG: hypothetical protein DWQ07_03695 [Chloroflexi bacterium]|nr:MAG: hypothetical protein DWQ07_03695 [Chloroflexota bacterium]MBL1193394.1 hypothetical protein [Chloroflexota bacterium]NOH10686.1 PH domain-containing protein [Chloroflexota bacterium]